MTTLTPETLEARFVALESSYNVAVSRLASLEAEHKATHDLLQVLPIARYTTQQGVGELAGFEPLSGRILKTLPTTFFRFRNLPPEIRSDIWSFALDAEPVYSRTFRVSTWS